MVDLWLQLLQRTLHLSQKLPRGSSSPVSRQGSLGEGLDPAMDIRSQMGTLVKSYRGSLQELMTQLLVHWKVTLSFHDQAGCLHYHTQQQQTCALPAATLQDI